MLSWVPVIHGVFYKPMETNVLPRVGDSVLLPVDEEGKPAREVSCGEKVYRVVDVRHYIAYNEYAGFEDVHLEEVK